MNVALVTDTLVPSVSLMTSILASSCLTSASTMAVPRPTLGGSPVGLADAVVGDRQFPVAAVGLVGDQDQRVGLVRREGIFDRVDDQFGDDQAEADGLVRSLILPLVGHDLDRDRLVFADHRRGQAAAQLRTDRTRHRSRRCRSRRGDAAALRPPTSPADGRPCRCWRVSSEVTARAFSSSMLAMICRLLATRCSISRSSTSFCRSSSSVRPRSSSFSRSIARRAVMSLKASRIVDAGLCVVDHLSGVEQHRPRGRYWGNHARPRSRPWRSSRG